METADTVPELELLEPLVSPFGPVVAARPTVTNPRRGLADLTYVGVGVGSGVPGVPIRGAGMNSVTTGGGKAVGAPDRARLIAIAEGAERYAAGNFLGEPRILASSAEMTDPIIGPDRIPRCSERELSDPKSFIRPLDPSAPIRWSLGTDLATGEPTWVPSVMAAYGALDLLPSEHFWHGISTGFAVHFDPIEALVGAIFEVIERDANAILWLQRLSLPLIADQELSPATEYLLDWSTRHFVDTYLFDATTDMGVPTVYCLQIADYDSRARHVVGAAAARDVRSAAEKALMEAVGARGVFYMDQDVKEDFASFSGVLDGARYMGRPHLAHAFSFLAEGASQRAGAVHSALPESPAEALSWLISALSSKGMLAVAIERTPRELAAVGLTAVNVVIPDLQPMSLRPLAQYRAHPRLYRAPELMGYPSYAEEDLNPWPQPFL